MIANAVGRRGHEDAEGEGRRRRQRAGRRPVPGDDRAETGQGDEEEEGADKTDKPAGVDDPDLGDLFFHGQDDDLEDILPARPPQPRRQPGGDESGADGEDGHQQPGEEYGGVELDEAVLPEDLVIGTQLHDRPPAAECLFVIAPTESRGHQAGKDETDETCGQP